MKKLIVLVCLSLLIFKTQAWNDNAFVRLSQAVASAGNLKDFWICHPSPHSVQSLSDPLALPVHNYTGVPDATVNSSIQVTHGIRVRLWHPPNGPHDLSAPCFDLTEMRTMTINCSEFLESDGSVGATWATYKDRAPPECKHPDGALNHLALARYGLRPYRTRSFDFLYENCRGSASNYKRGSSVCQEFLYPRDWGRLSICNHSLSEDWLIRANNIIPHNASVSVTGEGVLCAPKGYIFLCGGSSWYKDNETPQNSHEVWALQCLDGWRMSGSCTLGTLGVPLQLHTYNESIHWTSTRNIFEKIRSKRNYLTRIHISGFSSFVMMVFPQVGVKTKEMINRNLSHTMIQIADSMAQAIQAQQKSLNSLSRVVLDNKIALDFLLAQDGGICVIANSSCCTWINSTGQVEEAVTKIQQHAHWLHQIQSHSNEKFDLFSRFPTDVESWMLTFIQTGIIILIMSMILCAIISCIYRYKKTHFYTVFTPGSDCKNKQDLEC